MPESAEELYQRAAGALRMPEIVQWRSFPFEGDLRPKALDPPVAEERPRNGEGGVDCRTCMSPDDDYLWCNERWRLWAIDDPIGVPFIGLLQPREHHQEPGDLPDDLAADQGIMLGRVERAVRSIGEIGRVHVCRWGDGGAHLHWWFIARPARMPQLVGTFVAIWDDVLPPLPDDLRRANQQAVKAALDRGA